MCPMLFLALANNSMARILPCLDTGPDKIRYPKIAIVCPFGILLTGYFFIITTDGGKWIQDSAHDVWRVFDNTYVATCYGEAQHANL